MFVKDMTRANNISIILKIFDSFDGPSGIKQAILDGSDALTERHLEQLLHICPNSDEVEKIRAFDGDPTDLLPPEQFLYKMSNIPRLAGKIGSLLFKARFESLFEGAEKGMKALQHACQQIQTSTRLKVVLACILAAGNFLNMNTARSDATAIKLESILDLVDVKCTSRFDAENAPNIAGLHVPRLKSFLDFVAWKIMCVSVMNHDISEEELSSMAYNGYLTQELPALQEAVLLMESGMYMKQIL